MPRPIAGAAINGRAVHGANVKEDYGKKNGDRIIIHVIWSKPQSLDNETSKSMIVNDMYALIILTTTKIDINI
jgi:hypothetical protein